MPTYDYECGACGHTYELFQQITAKPVRKCPACGRPRAKRLIGTGAGVIFRGSGFYATDYRSDGYKSAAKAEKEGGSASKPTGESSKTTPKPESSPSTKAGSNGTSKKPKS